ncbi:MAG: hypothetical protein KME29_01770 [Calothrix sp. FI2-JRJ7]|jgi:hypothetical protein|nr:hypothetical protein [Calothrix sp. FI2-JRJ7]
MNNTNSEPSPVSNTLIPDTYPNNATNQHQQTTSWVGIRQYTSQLSPKKANPGYIARARAIYDTLLDKLIGNHPNWYITIEPDSGDYFLDADKDSAKQSARQKHPSRLTCTFQLIPAEHRKKID